MRRSFLEKRSTFEGSTLQTNISDHIPGNQSPLEAYGLLVIITLSRRQVSPCAHHIFDCY